MWGDGGEWEAEATIRTQTEVLYLQYVTWNDWCLWVVHESIFHAQTKSEFQLLCR